MTPYSLIFLLRVNFSDVFSSHRTHTSRIAERFLYHVAGLRAFTDFCKSEFSEENLEFWKACREFRRLAAQFEREKPTHIDPKAVLKMRADFIISNFVSEQAKKQVNIIATIRNKLLAEAAKGSVTSQLFADAEQQVLSLMSSDSFNRFKQSDQFDEMLKRLDCYTLGRAHQIKKVEEHKAHMRSGPSLLIPQSHAGSSLRAAYGDSLERSLHDAICTALQLRMYICSKILNWTPQR